MELHVLADRQLDGGVVDEFVARRDGRAELARILVFLQQPRKDHARQRQAGTVRFLVRVQRGGRRVEGDVEGVVSLVGLGGVSAKRQ
ncbi:hypothetical protein D3C72_2340560 [compost metagenome]